MKKMYTISRQKDYNYNHLHLDVVFDRNETMFESGEAIEMTWQCNKGIQDQYDHGWYGGQIKVKSKGIDMIKEAAKVMGIINKEKPGQITYVDPAEIVAILEAKGYKEAHYNKLTYNYETEQSWQAGSRFGIKLPGSRFGGFDYDLFADTEANAKIEARKLAAKYIAQGRDVEKWAEYLQDIKVDYIETGKEWESNKDKLAIEKAGTAIPA